MIKKNQGHWIYHMIQESFFHPWTGMLESQDNFLFKQKVMLDSECCTKLSFGGCEKVKSNFIVLHVTIVHVSPKLIRAECLTSKLYYVRYDVSCVFTLECVCVCQSCCNYYKLTENCMQVLIWRNYHCFPTGDPPERNRDGNAVFSLKKHGRRKSKFLSSHTSNLNHCVSSCIVSSLFIERLNAVTLSINDTSFSDLLHRMLLSELRST